MSIKRQGGGGTDQNPASRRARSKRREQARDQVCTICERNVPFCWTCSCGFRICQTCLDENAWGMTCNNITWECPDCGTIRTF